MMVAAISETTNQTRPPLLPSEKNNGIINNKSSTTRPKSRQISSRYLSPSPSTSHSNSNSNLSSLPTPTSSGRYPSPLVSRNTTTPAKNRSVSADRRRSTRPDLSLKTNNAASGGDVSAATKLLITSTRSLSVSFQGSSFSLPISKTKETQQSPNLRKITPERKRIGTPVRGKIDCGDNTKPVDQHRWPARTRQSNQTVLSKSLSLDCGVEKSNIIGSGNVIKALHQSINLDSKRSSIDGGRLSLDLGNCVIQQNRNGNSVNDSSMVQSDLTSDTDSVSSGSTSGVQESFGLTRSRSGSRGLVGSAKFWQETNSRMRRLQDPGAPFSTSPGSKLVTPSKMALAKKFSSDSPLSSPRTMASPNRMRPASPSKFMTSSPARGMVSPRRNSVSGTISTSFNETPSVLSFAVDVRRGKVGENRIVDAHLLRLLYNRQLQWRFVNAMNEDTLLKQRDNSEKNLWNAWITISDLRDSVTKKRHRLQLLKQKLKLATILKEQIAFLENWASLDKDHFISLLGAIEALKASTLRLPVGGAIADLQSMKDVISSAVDVMQAVCSSTCTLCVKVEEVNSTVNELANVCAKEQALLRLCKGLLSMLAALKVKDCSLRTHMLQTKCGKKPCV
ncbi:QWRF motif-containing protein 2-like [Rutidosis leptorrhynchoides]|uniref:QWRF motif-containing protein 2-like n=1 Tax=Rutidosis leptorrhynchoides TaxID=125765 RepID=UPI003A99FA64